MPDLIHIGTIERISLADEGIFDVPAKIDTGADKSAIWASNFHFEGNALVFNFFAPGSPFYKDQPVKTTDFRTTIVRNSFGQQEPRYKVKLRIQIGDHTLTRWFTLADRSRNSYPILLGKNFLKNKFVVDVSQKHLVGEAALSNKILVVSSAPQANRQLFDKVAALNGALDFKCVGYGSLLYYIGDEQSTKVVNVEDDNTDLATYAYTYFKSHMSQRELAGAAAEYLQFKGRPFADREVARYASYSKLTQYMKLARQSLTVPLTIGGSPAVMRERYDELASALGVPFVLKEAQSDKGKNNFFIDNREDYDRLLAEASPEHIYLAQSYIENDGFYRVLVLGKEGVMVTKRRPVVQSERLKSHLNKPYGGTNAELVEWRNFPAVARDMAIRSSQCLDRQIAGVDIIQDKRTEKWYILEVNSAPELRGGAYVDAKAKAIARYFDKELNR